ncbi:hypothetical protein G6F57_020049 [Rhizopus arrhizus]|nr:hypothetical protein G6F57_020049 [Rhizopus arrhizus]
MATAHADDAVAGRRHPAAAARAIGDDGRGVVAEGADGPRVGDGDCLAGDSACAAVAAWAEGAAGTARPALAAQHAGHDAFCTDGAGRARCDRSGIGDGDGARRAARGAVVAACPRAVTAVAAIAALRQRVDADSAVAGRGDRAAVGDVDLAGVAARRGLRIDVVRSRRIAADGTGDHAIHAFALAGDR